MQKYKEIHNTKYIDKHGNEYLIKVKYAPRKTTSNWKEITPHLVLKQKHKFIFKIEIHTKDEVMTCTYEQFKQNWLKANQMNNDLKLVTGEL